MKWNEISEAPKSSGSKQGFYDFEQGDNKVRIVSEAEVVFKHWINNKGVVCPEDDSCTHCGEGHKPKKQYACYLIDRRDGQLKVGMLPASVGNQLKAFSQEPDYAFEGIPPYDVNIKKTGEKLETEYSVIPARGNSELTSAEVIAVGLVKPIEEVVEAMKRKQSQQVNAAASDDIVIEEV